MLHAGLTATALADAAQVDPKSVGRWLVEDRVPHPVTRQKVAAVLQQQETFLWPTLLVESDADRAMAVGEIDQVWPTRSMISTETWHALFSGATRQLDILVYAGAFLIETLDLSDVLAWKASTGTRIRILVGDPDSQAVRLRAAELSLDWLPGRCASTMRYLQPVGGIDLRQHAAVHYASLFRFDDILLANTHAAGVWACHSPVLHLHRTCSSPLFDFYMHSFETIWRNSVVETHAPNLADGTLRP